MSILINKNGLLDTIQDGGRYGFQHLGINPGGVMDRIAMRIANALVGNHANEAILEMHFPAAEMIFEKTTLIAVSGADFSASINEEPIPILQPVLVREGALLRFEKKQTGARAYLAMQGGFVADEWLQSKSTNLTIKSGGYAGSSLHKNNRIVLQNPQSFSILDITNPFETLPWKAKVSDLYVSNTFRFIAGEEYGLLNDVSKQKLISQSFTIGRDSNRMGYRLQAEALQLSSPKEMISTAVTLGTIQLLPDGQLIVLMADHQTTGGYPRMGHIISADIPSLAQLSAGETFGLEMIDISKAENILFEQEMNLQQLQNACNFRLQEYLK